MLIPTAGDEVFRLSSAVLSLRPLFDVLPSPLKVAPMSTDPQAGEPSRSALLEGLLNRVAKRLGTPPFEVWSTTAACGLGPFSRVISSRLGIGDRARRVASSLGDSPGSFDGWVDRAFDHSFDRLCTRGELVSRDGSSLRVYAAGDRAAPAVALFSACGMPARLCERWIRSLARRFYVVTWETRGLFGACGDPDALDCGVASQAEDAKRALDHFGVERAHFLGMCGGATLALVAAARWPERVSSASLWHGDFQLGASGPRSNHQHNLTALMSLGASGRAPAAELHRTLCQAVCADLPPDSAHLVLYPYLTAELFYRYCRLNCQIMKYDANDLLNAVSQPVLVVTSADDATAHPGASRAVAATLPHSTLHVREHGDHLSLFAAPDDLLGLAEEFVVRNLEPAGGLS